MNFVLLQLSTVELQISVFQRIRRLYALELLAAPGTARKLRVPSRDEVKVIIDEVAKLQDVVALRTHVRVTRGIKS